MDRKKRNKKRIEGIQKGQKKRRKINKIRQEENTKARLERENMRRMERLATLSEEQKLKPSPRPLPLRTLSASGISGLELVGEFLDKMMDSEEKERFFRTEIIFGDKDLNSILKKLSYYSEDE